MTTQDITISDETLDLLRQVSTATLTTQLFKRGLRNTFLQGVAPLVKPAKDAPNMVGPAFTLRSIPAREDIDHLGVFQNPDHPQRKAVETAPPGSVLIQDCRGEKAVASTGSILMTRLKIRGVAGMVSDGCVRDSGSIGEIGLPLFCAGAAAPLNLAKHHAVDMNVPIACGGVAVYPGDIVVGDVDGVVIVPREMAEQVARDAHEQEIMEAFLSARIEGGAMLRGTYPPDEQTLAAYREWRKTRG
jgi:regulator of RNase E activity RraA